MFIFNEKFHYVTFPNNFQFLEKIPEIDDELELSLVRKCVDLSSRQTTLCQAEFVGYA